MAHASRFRHDFSRVAVDRDRAAAAGTGGPAVPLPFLDRIQPSFGRFDVSQTRAHLGPEATDAVAAVGARSAFTAGEHVAFAGAPSLAVAAHEATHVLQQRAGVRLPGNIDTPGDRYERQADAVAERVSQGRSSEGLLAGLPAISSPAPARGTIQRDDPKPPAPPPSAAPPLRYNRAAFTALTVPDPAHTVASLKAALKPRLKSYTVTGLGATSPKDAELFLYYLIYELSNKDNWGTEMDVVAPIERPAKATDPPPKARVTVRIDQDGNASAELVATGPTPEPPQSTLAAAKTKLKSPDWGFADVKDDGTATWSDAEISDVLEALTLLPAADKPALKGVELIRVKDLPGGFAGEFSTGGGTTGPGNTAIKSLPWLKLADKAFEHRAVQFYGGPKRTVPSSFDVILHEVGHAVEKEVYRGAAEAHTKALIDANKKLIPKNKYAKEHQKLTDDYAVLYDKWKKETDATKKAAQATKLEEIRVKRDEVYKKYEAADKPYQTAHALAETKEKEVPKTRVSAAAVVKPLETEAATAKTAASSALAAAKAQIGALQAADAASAKPWADALDAVAKEIQALATGAASGNIDDLERKVLDEVKRRDDARDALKKAAPAHPAFTALDLAASTQDAWFSAERTAARAPKRTLRLQKFVDLVTKEKIAPFTDYAKKNWPHSPEEFYAEAYALWRADPDFLSKNYQPVFNFFEGGDYRK